MVAFVDGKLLQALYNLSAICSQRLRLRNRQHLAPRDFAVCYSNTRLIFVPAPFILLTDNLSSQVR
jgi:hypothetical protein